MAAAPRYRLRRRGFSGWSIRWLGDLLNPLEATVPERVPFVGGSEPGTHAWSRFHIRYYTMALLFLAFDMELVFMYPWAVVFIPSSGGQWGRMGREGRA